MKNWLKPLKITNEERYAALGYDLPKKSKRHKRPYKENKEWKLAVHIRDNWMCVKCSSTEKLHAHHILEYAKHPDKRFDIDNGITLCEDCHKNVHPWLFRKKK